MTSLCSAGDLLASNWENKMEEEVARRFEISRLCFVERL